MKRYQLASLLMNSKVLAKQIMFERTLRLEYGDEYDPYGPIEPYEDDEPQFGDGPLTDEKDRKSFYKSLNPDSAMDQYGSARGFTAFIYSSATNTLFCQPGHEYHSQGIYETELAGAKKEPKGSKFLFGRFGKTEKAGGFVTVWKTAEEIHHHDQKQKNNNYGDNEVSYNYDANSYLGLKLGDVSTLKKMLSSMVQGTAKIVGNSPAVYPIDPSYVYTDTDGVREMVGNLAKGVVPQSNPACTNLAKLNVRGREMSFSTALGNLHMVKGPELDYIKAAICNDHDRLKAELQKSGCEAQLGILGDMVNRSTCPKDNQEDWKLRKQGGADMYRADLRKVFDNPEDIDSHFRGRQKDIDAAFDFLNRREHTILGFRDWITRNKQEKQ